METKQSTLYDLFRNRDFFWLSLGTLVSRLGDGVMNVSMVWFVYEVFKTPEMLATIGLISTLPELALLLFGGAVCDGINRKTLMIVSALIRAICVAGIAYLSTLDRPSYSILITLIVVSICAQSFYYPAYKSIIPDLIDKSMVMKSNSIDQLSRPLAVRFIGPALGGAMIASLGITYGFLFNAFSFVFAAATILLLRYRDQRTSKDLLKAINVKGLLAGFQFIGGVTPLWSGMVARCLALFLYWGPFQVLLPFLVKEELGGTAAELGNVFAMGGLGAILGSLVMVKLKVKFNMLFVGATWGSGLILVASYVLVNNIFMVGLISGLTSFLFTMGNVTWYSVIHDLTPKEISGRVWSIEMFALTGLIPISYAFIGPLHSLVGTGKSFLICGLAGGVITFLILAVFNFRSEVKMQVGDHDCES